MGRIDRPWLRRIPGYRERLRRIPGKRRPDEEPGEGPPMEEDQAGEPTEAEDGTEGAAPGAGEPGDEEQAAPPEGQPGEGQPSESPPADGEPQEGEADGEPASAEPPPDLDTSLHVPEEKERERREEEPRTPWNRAQAPRAFPLEGRYLRGLATRFARMVSKLAEDNADLPAEGDDEWDLNALVRRRFTGKLPNQCRMSREKRKVVVVLDTSPSCAHQARLFGSISQIAEELGDCEIYDAPNFSLISRWHQGRWEELPAAERDWPFRHRVVLAFGDFDGIEHICDASKQRGNRIYWFSCEERPTVLEGGRETFVHDYKGKYFPATQLPQLMRAMGTVR